MVVKFLLDLFENFPIVLLGNICVVVVTLSQDRNALFIKILDDVSVTARLKLLN